MKTIAKLRLLLAIALGMLTVTCVLLFLGMVTEVSADPLTWYVAPDGIDSPSCWQESSPCLTINYAISLASTDDTIIVTSGTFTESLTLNRAITLTGAGMGQTIIRASSPGITVTASNVTISGTTVVGEGSGEGITVTAGFTNASILNNEIQSYHSGIQLNGGNGHLLQGNVIAGNSIGLVAAGDLAFMANNNTISGSLTAGILFTGAGPITATLSGASGHANIFRNNTTNITVALPSTNANINAHWNDWGTNTIADIEETIYHKPDDAALARVDFYTLTIAAAPPTATADGITPIHITGTLGSFVTPGAGDVISFTTSLGRLNAMTATTQASGQASVVLTSTVTGTAVITATSGIAIHNVQTDTTTVTFTPDMPYTVTLVAYPTLQTVGINSVLTATAWNRYNNLVADGTPVTFTVSRGRVVSPVTTKNGVAKSLFSDTLKGTRTITATTLGAVSDTTTVTLVPGGPYSMTLTAVPPSPLVGFASVLNVTVRDQYSNTVADGTEVTFTQDWGNVSSPVTTTNGAATSSIATIIAGADHVTATSGTAYAKTTVTFRPDVPNSLVLQSDPSQQVVGNKSVLTATVRDQYTNLVGSGIPVTFTVSRGSVVSRTVTTNGIATSRISDTLTGTRTITATTLRTVSDTTTVTFIPGAPFTVTLVATPTVQVVGKNSVLTATVYDRYANRVENGTPVTLTVSRGSVASPVTTTNGVATSLFSDTLRGTRTITATSGSAPPVTRTVTFTTDKPFTITVQVYPVNLIANTGATATVTATVMDAYANPIVGQIVTGSFPITSMGTVSIPGATNAEGQVVGTWTAGSIISHTFLYVANGSISGTAVVTLTYGAPQTLTVQVKPAVQSAFSGATATITATVIDRYKNAIQGLALSGDTSPATLGSVSWPDTTDANGQAFGLWTATSSSVAGNGLLRVEAGSIISTVPITLTPGHIYLPSILRDYMSQLIKNGDFSQPDLADWNRDQNPLPVSPSTDDGNPAALLGNPAYPCESGVPRGYGSLSQSFVMPDVPSGKQLFLKLKYHIYTNDKNDFQIPGYEIYDKFDVLLNNNLVLSDMNQDQVARCPALYDLGRKEARILVTGSSGESISIVFRLQMGPDDRYNTYVYVDDVRLEFEP